MVVLNSSSLLVSQILRPVVHGAVNIGKAKYMEIGRHRGVIANAHIKIGSNSYEKVETFKYLGSLLTSKFYSGGNKM